MIPGNISILDQEDDIMIITREESSAVNKSIGIQLTMTGDQSTQKEVLKQNLKFL